MEAVPRPTLLIELIATKPKTKLTDDELKSALKEFREFLHRANDVLEKELFKLLESNTELQASCEELDKRKNQGFKTKGAHGKSGWLKTLKRNEPDIMAVAELRNRKAQCEQDIKELRTS